jgi:mannose-6-phosphate isomerase-like protein (cupin superfamily)
MMQKTVIAIVLALSPLVASAQSRPGTYITDEEIKKVNALPGVDRQIRVVDVGTENVAVGVVHRGASAPAGAPAGGAPAGAAPAAPAAPVVPCGEVATPPPAGGVPGGILHDSQTEGYIIISGGGTLVTGGHIVNGRKSAPDSSVTTTLNGPSCSGMITGDFVKKVVKTGDIIIIPAGTPHGWIEVGDHVDYLSIRPSARVLPAGYVNPALK